MTTPAKHKPLICRISAVQCLRQQINRCKGLFGTQVVPNCSPARQRNKRTSETLLCVVKAVFPRQRDNQTHALDMMVILGVPRPHIQFISNPQNAFIFTSDSVMYGSDVLFSISICC